MPHPENNTPGHLPDNPPGAVYLAPAGFEQDLEQELQRRGKHIVFRQGRLLGTREEAFEAIWADNIWFEPCILPIRSITDGARQLKALQRNWALFSVCEHRRARLIEQQLPKVSARPLVFGSAPPTAPLGSWTLLGHDRILASPACSSPFANGRAEFVENKTVPPNRAYLKLWELFTRTGIMPGPGDLCLDLGSSPGGWTWVLAELGARVFSIDKAPLADNIAKHPLVNYCGGSAFALEPRIAGDVSWLFCDVACYPERLFCMVQRWIEAGCRTNYVCTIKFTGMTDFHVLDRFLAVSGSRAMHLYVNKHEVTWFFPSNKIIFA